MISSDSEDEPGYLDKSDPYLHKGKSVMITSLPTSKAKAKKRRRALDAYGNEKIVPQSQARQKALARANKARGLQRIEDTMMPYYQDNGWEGLCDKYPKEALRVLRLLHPADPGYLGLCKRPS